MLDITFKEKISLWLKYINVFSPGHPLLGNLNSADCIIAQTFGRSMYEDRDLSSIMDSLPHPKNDILTFKYLANASFHSGVPNIELAKNCFEIIDNHGIPLLAQWEIAFEMFNLDQAKYIKLKDFIIPIWPVPYKNSFTTNDVLETIKKIMSTRMFTAPVLVANNWMSIRATLLIKKRIGVYPILTSLDCFSFNPSSTQWWTKSYIKWISKEILVRIHHITLGWV